MFKAKWKGPIEGYTVNYLSRNYWRVSNIMTREDAMQEARVAFLQTQQKFPDCDNARWFMALYKKLLANRFHDLSNEATEIRDNASLSLEELREEDGSNLLGSASVEFNEGYLHCLIAQAPEEVQELLVLLLNSPIEVWSIVREAWCARRGSHRKLNVVLCNLVGKDPARHDFVNQLRRYLS